MLNSLSRLLLLFPLMLSAAPAAAQAGPVPTAPPGPVRSAIVIAPPRGLAAAAWREELAQPATQTKRDSLWNGTLVGMGLGALTGAFAGNAWLDDSATAGFNVPLTFGVIGAGAGAGIGAWIDAMHGPKAQAPRRTTRIGLAPVIGKETRGALGWIRF